MDIDPNVSMGMHRCKKKWWVRNRTLATQLKAALDTSCRADLEEGKDHEVDKDDFLWPDEKKSELLPLDPFNLGLRREATRPGKPLFEIDRVDTAGVDGVCVVPIFVVTAFYKLDQPTAVRPTGDLRINISEDSDEDDYFSKPQRKRRNQRRDDEPMNDADDGGGKPAAKGGGSSMSGVGYTILKVATLGMFG